MKILMILLASMGMVACSGLAQYDSNNANGDADSLSGFVSSLSTGEVTEEGEPNFRDLVKAEIEDDIDNMFDAESDGLSDEEEQVKRDGIRACRLEIREYWLAIYDENANGEFDQEERQMRRDDHQDLKDHLLGMYDTDPETPGMSQEGKEAFAVHFGEVIVETMLGKYDGDEDGKVSADEVNNPDNSPCTPIILNFEPEEGEGDGEGAE